jgi:hypothetical protein
MGKVRVPVAVWIKGPLAIFAERAANGLVIADGRIVELVAAGKQPATAFESVMLSFQASSTPTTTSIKR